MSNRRARGRAWARAFEDRFVAKNGVASPLDIYLTGLDLASPEELDAPYFALTRRQAILVRANIMVNGEGEEPDFLEGTGGTTSTPISNPSKYDVLSEIALVCLHHDLKGKLVQTMDLGDDTPPRRYCTLPRLPSSSAAATAMTTNTAPTTTKATTSSRTVNKSARPAHPLGFPEAKFPGAR
jgi:hypothetical protein